MIFFIVEVKLNFKFVIKIVIKGITSKYLTLPIIFVAPRTVIRLITNSSLLTWLSAGQDHIEYKPTSYYVACFLTSIYQTK